MGEVFRDMYRINANQEKSEKIYFLVEVYIADMYVNLYFYVQTWWTCNSDWLFWYCVNSDSKVEGISLGPLKEFAAALHQFTQTAKATVCLALLMFNALSL